MLISIANHVDPDGSGWVHVRRVLQEANCSLDSYRRAVQEAVEQGELVRETHAGGSVKMHDAHRPNLFTFPALSAKEAPVAAVKKQPAIEGPSSDVLRVFERWVLASGRDLARTRLTTQRRRKVEARLKEGYSVNEILAAIEGVQRSPFHQGANDTGTRYDDLTVICRDGAQVERFADLAAEPATSEKPVIAQPRGCELCDNGFIFHGDNSVSICKCTSNSQKRA